MNVAERRSRDIAARHSVLEGAVQYFDQKPAIPFKPGESYIPASGKVIDAGDVQNMVDASLDAWLTVGGGMPVSSRSTWPSVSERCTRA